MLFQITKEREVLYFFRTFDLSNLWSPLTSYNALITTQPAIACSKLTIETLEQGVKYVQS